MDSGNLPCATCSETEVHSRLQYFVTEFRTKFEDKSKSYFEQLTGVTSKTGKSSKIAKAITGAVPLPQVAKQGITGGIKSGIDFVSDQLHSTKASAVTGVVGAYGKEELSKILVEAGTDLFFVLESQLMQIENVYFAGWKVGISIMVTDLVDRIMNYIHSHREKDPTSQFKLCDSVLTKCALYGSSKLEILEDVVDFRGKEYWSPRRILEKAGVFLEDKDAVFIAKSGSQIEKYGARRPFNWKTTSPEEYTETRIPSQTYKYILKAEDLPQLKNELFQDIQKENAPIPELIEEVKNVQTELAHKANEIIALTTLLNPIWFEVSGSIPFSPRRQHLLQRLRSLLLESSTGKLLITQEPQVSRKYQGNGKSELVRKYIGEFANTDFNRNCIWLNASNYDSLEESLNRLILMYFPKITIYNVNGIIKELDQIVEDICKHLESHQKALFIFDNLTQNEEDYVDYDKILGKLSLPFYTIVTSKHPNWTSFAKSLESAESLVVGVLSKAEVEEFIKLDLGSIFKEPLPSDFVESLAKKLNYDVVRIEGAINEIKSFNRNRRNNRDHYCQNVSQMLLDLISKLNINIPMQNLDSQSLQNNDNQREERGGITWPLVGGESGRSRTVTDSFSPRTVPKWLKLEDNKPIGMVHLLAFVSPQRFLDCQFFSWIFSKQLVELELTEVENRPGFIIDKEERTNVRISVSHEAQSYYRSKMEMNTFKESLCKIVEGLYQAISLILEESFYKEETMLSDYLAHFSYAWGFSVKNPIFVKLNKIPFSILEKLRDSGRFDKGYIFGYQVCRKLTKGLGVEHDITRRGMQCYQTILDKRKEHVETMSTITTNGSEEEKEMEGGKGQNNEIRDDNDFALSES